MTERAAKVEMKNQRLLEISEWTLLAAAAAGSLMALRVAIHQFAVSYQLNYEEGNILNSAVRIIHGANPYPAVQPPVYVFNTYGPVVYYLIAPLVKLFGPSFEYPRMLVVEQAGRFPSPLARRPYTLISLLRRRTAPEPIHLKDMPCIFLDAESVPCSNQPGAPRNCLWEACPADLRRQSSPLPTLRRGI